MTMIVFVRASIVSVAITVAADIYKKHCPYKQNLS